MHQVTLLTGSNEPSAAEILERAADMLSERVGRVEAASHIYRSEPWGFSAERPFCNQALRLTSGLEPMEVLDAALAVEQSMGRRRDKERKEREVSGQRYASRVIDIDVMFYDNEVMASPRLTLPHPLLHEREFALVPLCEIMGDMIHPVLGQSLNRVLKDLKQR